MSLKITTLVENTLGEHLGLRNEHGISFLVETEGGKLLFDAGQSDALLHNARQLNLRLDDVGVVALSHGHYDHSGGLRSLVAEGLRFELHVGEGFFQEKYARFGAACEYLGNSFDRAFLEDAGVAVRTLREKSVEALPGVHLLTGFERRHEDESPHPRFLIRREGGFERDMFADELMVAVKTPKGLVVLLGCSHPGVKNMLDAAMERLGQPIYAVLGGTHLVESAELSLEKTVNYFREKDIQAIGVSHCTGKLGMQRLSVFEDRYFHNRTGSSLFVEY